MHGRRMLHRVAALAVLLLVVGSCGRSDGDGQDEGTAVDDATDVLRVGMFNFAESALLAELYATALDGAGVPVRRVAVDGPREIMAPALLQGRLDLLPEYLGTASSYYGDDPSEAPPITVELLREMLEPRGVTALTPSTAQNTNVFVVDADSGLGPDLSDLGPVAAGLRFGGLAECRDRPLCLVGLESTYGLRFAEFVPQPSVSITAEALRRDEIDVGLMFSTNPELTSEFIVLDDDQNLQPAENVVPVVRLDALERWGDSRVRTTLDAVSAALTTDELRTLNRRARREAPADVAREWLAERDLAG